MNYSFEVVDLDTNLFGFKVAKIISIDDYGNSDTLCKRVCQLIVALKQAKVAYATYRLSSNAFPIIHAIEREGFVIVDGVVDLSANINDMPIGVVKDNIREAKVEDINNLKKIAEETFLLNRFYWDPIIPKDKAPFIYGAWVENSVIGKEADCVFIIKEKEKIVGFITLEKKGHIPLIAVASDFQGKGIAKILLNAAFTRFRKWGVKQINIETTFLNLPALRAYLAIGFIIVGSRFTFRWSDKVES